MSAPGETAIAIDVLKAAAETLIERVREVEGDTVSLRHDMFWSIPADELFDVYNEPEELTVGQLSDSWDQISRITSRDDAPVGYALVWLADVLRAVGCQTTK